jgi:hypothetical protein
MSDTVFVFRDKVATQLKRPEIWERMDEEVARRAEEQKIRDGEMDIEGEFKGDEKVIYIEK